MRYLLDTHVLIWFLLEDNEKISTKLKKIIKDPKNDIYISIATLWEITIKLNINKFVPEIEIEDFFSYLRNSSLILLNIEEKYLLEYRYLTLIHREPFDRLLIATAISENLTLITHDKKIQEYPIKWLWE